MSTFARVSAFLLFTAALAAPAGAALVMTLSDGTNTVTVTDQVTTGSYPDQDPGAGVVTWSGAIGSLWASTTIGTGASNSPGSSVGGVLQVQSIDVRNLSGSRGNLTITVSDVGFNQPAGPSVDMYSSLALTDYLSTSGDSVTFQSYADPTNAGLHTITTGLETRSAPHAGTVGTKSFSDDAGPANFTYSGAYSLTNVTNVSLSPGGQINLAGTTSTYPIPEPASAALLGLAAMLLIRKRR